MDTTLRSSLRAWTGVEAAMFTLALCLGVMREEPGLFQIRAKHVVASNNPIGNMLYNTLEALVSVGILEQRETDEIEYRWNPAFRGTWE